MALERRPPGTELVHHSERGPQYLSDDLQLLFKRHGITCSMRDRTSCYANAVVEAFYASLKHEPLKWRKCPIRDGAKADLFDYIERLYNRQRCH